MTNKKIQTQGALFAAVQLSGLFNDSKAFPDSISLHPPEGIEASFRALLEEFIARTFNRPLTIPKLRFQNPLLWMSTLIIYGTFFKEAQITVHLFPK